MRENGRSMVEMLGVLAIIAVLSVGAIAGYSKAMMKYKLNKYSEQISQLLGVLSSSISDKYYSVKPEGTDVAKLLNDLKMLPDGMWYKNSNVLQSSLYPISIYIRGNENVLYLHIMFDKDKTSIEACVKAFEIIKNYTNESSLFQVWLERPYNYYYAYSNGKTCWFHDICLTEMTTTDFYVACKKNYDEYINGSAAFQFWIQYRL